MDNEIKIALEWFLSFTSKEGWENRRSRIERAFLDRIKGKDPNRKKNDISVGLSVMEDAAGWNLFLVEAYLMRSVHYEPVQGARIIPVFKRFGIDLELLKGITGVDKKVRDLLKQKNCDADAIFFELLTALLWARNGYRVSFIDVRPPLPSPDLLAEKGGERFQIECKRLSKSSDYSIAEREKWFKIWQPIKDLLAIRCLLLKVVFHVELVSLNNDFAFEQLRDKLDVFPSSGLLVSNEYWQVHAERIDMDAVNEKLSVRPLRQSSPEFRELLGSNYLNGTGFTMGLGPGAIAEENGHILIGELRVAFAIDWSCDAPVANDKKARGIYSKVKDALKQFDHGESAFIHIGMETLDGPDVEKIRFDKIKKTMETLVLKQDGLEWVFVHFFQSGTSSNKPWYIDESVSDFHKIDASADPLTGKMLLSNWDGLNTGLHWEL